MGGTLKRPRRHFLGDAVPIAFTLALLLMSVEGIACESDGDCKAPRRCIEGACTNTGDAPIAPGAPAPATPPDTRAPVGGLQVPPTVAPAPGLPGTVDALETPEAGAPNPAEVLIFDDYDLPVDRLVIGTIVFLIWSRRRTRFATLEGERLLCTTLLRLGNGTNGDIEAAEDIGKVISRLALLDRRARRARRVRVGFRPAVSPLLVELLAHPRFEDIEALATDRRGKKVSFAMLRAQFSA